MTSMREFLQTGRLGEVQPGLGPQQVTERLGPPEDQSVKRRPVQLFRYGAVEFAFMVVPGTADSRMVAVAIYFQDPDRAIPPPLRPTDWVPTGATTEQEFREFLEKSAIEAHASSEGEQAYLTLDSGASIVFTEGRLHSIHFRRREKKAHRKQMTVSLSEDTVKILQHRARDEGVSVHDLIERMIRAGA